MICPPSLSPTGSEADGRFGPEVAVGDRSQFFAELSIVLQIKAEARASWIEVQGQQFEAGEVLYLVDLDQGATRRMEVVAGQRRGPLRGLSGQVSAKCQEMPSSARRMSTSRSGSPRWPCWFNHGSRARTSSIPSEAAVSAKARSQSPTATRAPYSSDNRLVPGSPRWYLLDQRHESELTRHRVLAGSRRQQAVWRSDAGAEHAAGTGARGGQGDDTDA